MTPSSLTSLTALVVSAVLTVAVPARAADQAGQVQDLTGQAFSDAAQQRRALEKTSPVFVGDRVQTAAASRLTMRLGRDTTVKLGESTQLVIDKFLPETGGEISLEQGPMQFDRPSGARKMPVQIRSPYAMIAVRGTKFFAGPSNGVFGVFVEQGRLTVSGGGKTVTLAAGDGTDVAAPGAIPSDPKRWGEARIKAALASVR